MHVDPHSYLSRAFSECSAGIHELRFAADADLAFARPAQLKPDTLAGRTMAELNKDPSVLEVLAELRRRFSDDAFDIVDHWYADMMAVGVATRSEHGQLVYFSTATDEAGRFCVELEKPRVPGDDFPYKSAGVFDNVDFNELVKLVVQHLRLSAPP